MRLVVIKKNNRRLHKALLPFLKDKSVSVNKTEEKMFFTHADLMFLYKEEKNETVKKSNEDSD